MARTTPELVAGIIEVDDGDDLEPFIDVANELVTEVCAPVVTYSAPRLEKIERWLAAHFYAIQRPRNFLEQAGTLREQIESKVDLGFNVTRYGQQAMRLDTAGGLAALDAQSGGADSATVIRPKRSMTWLGRPPE